MRSCDAHRHIRASVPAIVSFFTIQHLISLISYTHCTPRFLRCFHVCLLFCPFCSMPHFSQEQIPPPFSPNSFYFHFIFISFASHIFFAAPAAAALQVPCCANRPSQRKIFLSVTDKRCQEQARRLLKPVSWQISRYLCSVLDTPLALVPILYQRVFSMIQPTGTVPG